MVAKLNFAPRVTIEQGRVFADELIKHFLGSDGKPEAFGRSKVIEWPEPDAPFVNNPEGVERYGAIRDEIVERVVEALREPIAEAFVAAAREVLARERRRT